MSPDSRRPPRRNRRSTGRSRTPEAEIHAATATAAREARIVLRESVLAANPTAFVADSDLPIAAAAADIAACLETNQVVIVAGETGSGKSTQLPKICLAAGRGVEGMIGHTQPRRVAARSVAERVAEEIGSPIGAAVGYTVRFNDEVSEGTLVRVMTDGILLNELQRDRNLSRYDTLIIDEAHERSLNIDFILGYIKQLLPRRPDLRIIVTSATIDTERFAEFFAAPDGTPAPIFAVEGRTYPVELRYRPFGGEDPDAPDDDRDQVTAIIDAVREVAATGPGDVLVFLSGEREIHDTADALRDEAENDRTLRGIEILPLYARLSASEQHRIFEPHRGRRVVLATNVAETSITVPGVRFVVDTGTARISRFSRRLKVQRLPIEPISQASANQRAGRCGRVAPGICVRLYTEADFDARPEFTEPEILRTNLASVILQMTALGLGDVERFPFVEAPEHQSIRDGWVLLDELGALEPGVIGAPRRLTPVGRQLARLPIDPRLGRMVVEAQRWGAVREVLVIASALSIQDVRERPRDHPEKANELHRRFNVEGSDLLSIVALWDYLRDQQRERSGNSFRRMCRSEYLHYLRIREWRDLYSQLRQVAGQLGIRPGVEAAHPDHVHRAVLAGLLSHLGMRDGESRDFRGARDSRFVIAPGSVLSRRPPRWLMAAELVETHQLFARRVATIQPEWAEDAGRHLVKRSFGEAWWDEASARALTTETVTLYGLPIVSNRTIGVDRVDPVLAREMFIRHALVDGDWEQSHAFIDTNARFHERVRQLEARVRRTDLLDPEAIVEFFDARLPNDIVSGRSFEKWWNRHRRDEPNFLDLTGDVLQNRSGIRLADYPDTWRTGDPDSGPEYRIVYRFEPGTPLDGASVVVPLTALGQVDASRFDWGVAGYRPELAAMLVRALPKHIRRELIPMAETTDAALDVLNVGQPGLPPDTTFRHELARALTQVSGVAVSADDFDLANVPTHLRLHIVVVDGEGAVVDAGDDLEAIRRRQQATARHAIADASAVVERQGIVSWDLGELDRVVERRVDAGHVVRAYPTLLDRGDSVSLRVVDNEALQARAMRGGVRRLLMMVAAPTPTKVARGLDNTAKLAIIAAGASTDDLAADAVEAAVDAVMSRYDLPWSDKAFGGLEKAVRADAPLLASDALAEAADILAAANRVRARTKGLHTAAIQATLLDLEEQLDRLTAPGFVTRTGTDRLPDVHRYVRGIEYRLDHLNGDIPRDRRRMAELAPIVAEYAAAVAASDRVSDELREVAWMIEEYRIALFAQPLGAHGAPSPKKIRQAIRAAS